MQRRWLGLLLTGLLGVGCASQKPLLASMNFPTRDRMDALLAKPLPPVKPRPAPPAVADWKLAGPFPGQIGLHPHPEDTVWEQAFVQQLKAQSPAGALTASGGLHCVAREVGRFALANDALPPDELQQFIAGRCGVSAPALSLGWSHGEIPEATEDAEVLAQWNDSIPKAVASAASASMKELGLWFGRSGRRGVVVTAASRPKASVQTVAVIPDVNGGYTLMGEVSEPAEDIDAAINHGAFGYARCDEDTAVLPPRFAFRCTGSAEDADAWIEVSARPKGRLLSYVVARLLVSPSTQPSDAFQRARYETQPPAKESFAASYTAYVNEVRARAGLLPLELDLRQTETAAKVAPHFLASAMGAAEQPRDTSMEDALALGMMAGWDVEGGVLSYGTFASDWVAGTTDVRDLVTSSLILPSGRAVLLRREARRIAVGELPSNGQPVRAAVTSTYVFLERRPLMENAARVIASLNRARAALGFPPVTWTAAPGNSAQEAADRVEKGESPDQATDHLLRAVVEATNSQIRGWTVYAQDLDEMEFPDDMVRAPSLAVVVSVGLYRHPEDPWGRYVVMMALPAAQNVKPTYSAGL